MKKFLGTFFYSILLIIAIIIVFDLAEKLDDFMEKKVPFSEIIFEYYLNFAPFYINMFMFLFTFISVIFFTSKMASNSEIIAILSSGVSFNRFLRPYFMSAALLALFSYALSNYIIPPANKVRLDFENKYINGQYYNDARNIHKQIRPGVFIYMENFVVEEDKCEKFSMERFEDKKLVSKLISQFAAWDSTVQKWRLANYYIRNINGDKEEVLQGPFLDTNINMTPMDFKHRVTAVETLNKPKLEKFIEAQKLHGAEKIETFLIEKYKRIAYPLATFILTLIGVVLSARKVRGGTGINLGLGLLLSFSYILFMQIFAQFAIASTMNPMLAVWIPNILYGIIALILYKVMPR